MDQLQTNTFTGNRGKILRDWFNPLRGGLGLLAFVLNRVTGIGLVVYLALHLVVLSRLFQGEAGWNNFITLARSPLFLMLDVILMAGMLIHGLNGVRVALVGMGLGVKGHKATFVVLMLIAAAVLAYAAFRVFTA
jgi:succinate dehydrogenase / fumarate reductase, cytochrome b subunit